MEPQKRRLSLIAMFGLAVLLIAAGLLNTPFASGQAADPTPIPAADAELDAEKPAPIAGTGDIVLIAQARAIFGKLPDEMPGSENDTPELIELGKKLYFEKGLSVNDTQSCADCHPIDNNAAGADNRKTGLGALGKTGDRNDPPSVNAGYQIAQFWDGRAATLAEQGIGPILNPIEMGIKDEATALAKLEKLGYKDLFVEAFPDAEEAFVYRNVGEAIAAFERTLVSKGRIDKFIDGDAAALSTMEKKGLNDFIHLGCIQCHGGPNYGGMMFQKMGIFAPYANTEDVGRFKVTEDEADMYVFKVPILRNVTLTGPYFHDGAAANLGAAIDEMARLQLGRTLDNEQIEHILNFFSTLADEKRTTATPAEQKDVKVEDWEAPALTDIPAGEAGDEIRKGLSLLRNTYVMLGSNAREDKQYSGNMLACTSCHQEEGRKQLGLPWVGVTKVYPQYRGRENREVTLAERINGCFERSMNGEALPEDSEEMKAIIAYMDWLSKDVTKEIKGLGTPEFDDPNRAGDPVRGAEVYQTFCLACHGKDGQGYTAVRAGANGQPVIPAIWGDASYNDGAGTHRLLTGAAFIQGNMPLGTPWNRPVLNADDAYDVAAYTHSLPRPKMDGLEKDYPDLTKKPVDAPYGPYNDSFPQEQHEYGPFQPIRDAKPTTN